MSNRGRPLKFKSPEKLRKKAEKYFESCWRQKIDMYGNPIFEKDEKGKKTEIKVMEQFRPYTITGLALALDTTRDVLIDYEDKNKEFSNTIKELKERCHNYAEESLFIGKNPTGAMFNLKNNYNWKDKSELDLNDGREEMSKEKINKIIRDVDKCRKISKNTKKVRGKTRNTKRSK